MQWLKAKPKEIKRTMKFMFIVKATKDSEAGRPFNPQLMAEIQKRAEEAFKSGTLIANGGLLPSSRGSRINVSKGKVTVTDGPFAEAKELVGGFAIFELPSKEEAIKSGTGYMQLHADILGSSYEGELEIRPMMDPADFGAKH